MYWLRDTKKRSQYYEETSIKTPSSFLLQSLKYAKGAIAVDLGCGSGVDTKEISRNGFKVIAVDVNHEVTGYFNKEDLKQIELIIKPIEEFAIPNCDFIYAKSSLVFLSPKKFWKVMEEIKSALNPNGVFTARLWGKKDSSNKSGKNFKYTFTSIEELKETFAGYSILVVDESEEDKCCADGRMKHWDFINIIVQKPSGTFTPPNQSPKHKRHRHAPTQLTSLYTSPQTN